MPASDDHQNITLRLSRQTIQKAKVLAARRSTSLSGLLASQLEEMAKTEDEYYRAMRESIALMSDGFNSGSDFAFDRESLHER